MSQQQPAGWYPDSEGNQRYWDGAQWTEHSQPAAGQAFAAGAQVPATQPVSAAQIQDEKTMAMLAQLLGIFTGFLGPLVMYLVAKDDQPFLKHHAAESLKFQITLFIGVIVSAVLMLVLIGFLLFFVVWIGGLVLAIVATMAANRGEWYRYPINIRMVPGARG